MAERILETMKSLFKRLNRKIVQNSEQFSDQNNALILNNVSLVNNGLTALDLIPHPFGDSDSDSDGEIKHPVAVKTKDEQLKEFVQKLPIVKEADKKLMEAVAKQRQILEQQNVSLANLKKRPTASDRIIILEDLQLVPPNLPFFPQTIISNEWSNTVPFVVGSGIFNQGNSCYVSATLQALFHLAPFANWLMHSSPHATMCADTCRQTLSCHLLEIFNTVRENLTASPQEFLDHFRTLTQQFPHGVQQDGSEFLLALLDEIEKEHGSNTAVTKKFKFKTMYQTTCSICNKETSRIEEGTSLDLQIVVDDKDLEEMLQNYCKSSFENDERNLYECETCKKKVPFITQLKLQDTPDVLIIALKRFHYYRSSNTTVKKYNAINIPMQLQLPESTERYELVSTINHLGDFDFGHYTCSAKTINSFKVFDDTKVKTVTQLKNDEAYVLLYKRVNASPPAIADADAEQQEEVEQNTDGTDDQATHFKRNINSRTTPLNVKKKVINAGSVVDKNANIEPTKLRHKKATQRGASYTPKWFNTEQAKQVQQWAAELKNGRHKMPHGSIPKLIEKIKGKFLISMNSIQLTRWVNSNPLTKDIQPDRTLMTKNEASILYEIRMEAPKMTWKQIKKDFDLRCPHLSHLTTTQLNWKINKYVPDQILGEWTLEEEKLLLAQYMLKRTSWSKYDIPGRNSNQIRQKFFTMIMSATENLNGETITSLLFKSINRLREEGEETTRENIMNELMQSIGSIGQTFVSFVLTIVLDRCVQKNRIKKTQENTYELVSKEERLKLETLRYKRQPLREPLNKDERAHIDDLMDECKEEFENNSLQWFNTKKFPTIAVTAFVNPREINFQSSDNIFEDDIGRTELQDILDKADSESDDDNDDGVETDDQLIDLHREEIDFNVRALGFIRLLNSKRILLFFTTKHDIYEYIHKQLQLTRNAYGCPSWMKAFVTDRNRIDWNNIKLFTLAKGYRAALRLKLSTVRIMKTPCYNVRQETFLPIKEGLDEYLNVLTQNGLEYDDEKVELMLSECCTK